MAWTLLVLATTLLDAGAFPRDAIAVLYRVRWYAEMSQSDYRSRECLYLNGWAA